MDDRRQSLLLQILTGDARERLGRLSIVKPDKARLVEDYLINMAQTGKIPARLGEKELINLLEQVSGQQKQTKITVLAFIGVKRNPPLSFCFIL